MRLSKKACLEDARKYTSLKTWKRRSKRMADYMAKHGYMNELFDLKIFKKRPFYLWTFELCKKEAAKYDTRSSWNKASSGSYRVSIDRGWIDHITKHMLSAVEASVRGRLKWTKELVQKEALKYDQISKWAKGSPGSYGAAISNKWVPEFSSHMKVILNKWTKEACLADALKYTRKGEWNKKSAGAFKSARRNGWAVECMAHMHQARTLEDCKVDALKYKTRDQWAQLSPGPYWSAQRNGWVNEACSHMPEHAICDLREKRAVDKLIKIIKKELTKEVRREEFLGKYFPDLTLVINEKFVIVEVKHDQSGWKKIIIEDQMEKYKKQGKAKYKENFAGCYLCSPNGRYGYDFKSLIKVLKELK